MVEELLASKDDHPNGFQARPNFNRGGAGAGGGFGQKSLGEVSEAFEFIIFYSHSLP